MSLSISVDKKERNTIIRLKGGLNIENIKILDEFWNFQLTDRPRAIALSMKDLRFIDSSAIGLLVKYYNEAARQSIDFVILDISSSVKTVFDSAKLSSFFKITSEKTFKEKYSAKKVIV